MPEPDTGRLTGDDRFLIAEARRIAPALSRQASAQQRLAGELLQRLADRLEELGQDGGAS